MCHGVLAFVFNSCTFTLSKCEMNEWGENNDKKATKNYVSSIRHSKNSPLVWLLFFFCQDIHDTFLPTAFSFSLFAADVCATTWRIHSFFAYKHPFQQQVPSEKKGKRNQEEKNVYMNSAFILGHGMTACSLLVDDTNISIYIIFSFFFLFVDTFLRVCLFTS